MAEATDQPRFSQRIARRLRSKWIVVPVVVLSLVVLSVFAFRLSQLRGVPDIGHPFDVVAFGTIDIDPANNAKVEYEHAFGWLTLSSEPEGYEDLTQVFDGTWLDASPDVRQWLSDNETILELWQEGSKKDHFLDIQPADLTGENSIGSIGKMRQVSRLVRLAAIQAETEGRIDESWGWLRALFRSSRHLGMYGTEVPLIVGASNHSMVVDGIIRWANSEYVTAEQLSRALDDIREADNLTALPSSVIRAAYFVTLDEMNRIDEMRKWRHIVVRTMDTYVGGFADDRARFPGFVEMFIENDPELTKRLLQHQVANLLTFADLPLTQRPALVLGDITYFDAVSDEAAFMPPKDFLNAVNRSPYARLTLLKAGWINGALVRERARQTMLEVILAAEWYRRKHGTFPESIKEMVADGMLATVPVDPMNPSGGFVIYERNSDNPQQTEIWCVGRNGIDDGGEFDIPYAYIDGDYGFNIGRNVEEQLNSFQQN